MSINVMKAALEALENGKRVRAGEGGTKHQVPLEDAAITALRQAIEQAGKVEPVAWMVYFDARLGGARVTDKLLVWRKEQAAEQVKADLIQSVEPLYQHSPTAPAQPVGIVTGPCGQCKSDKVPCYCSSGVAEGIKKLLSAAPAAPAQQPLSVEAIWKLEDEADMDAPLGEWKLYFARAIEAAHGIKGASL